MRERPTPEAFLTDTFGPEGYQPQQAEVIDLHQTNHEPDQDLHSEATQDPTPSPRHWYNRFGGRTALAGVLLVAGGAVMLQEEPSRAEGAQTAAESLVPHAVYRTGGDGVWLHESPGIHTPLKVVMPEGSQFNVDCFVTGGDNVNGNRLWLQGEYNGTPGAVTDYYIDTHWNTTQDLVNQGIEECGTQPAAAPAPEQPSQESYDVLPDYNRQKAVSWALSHGSDTPPFDGACTWFASNALWAGGLPETNEWHSWGGHGKPKIPGLPDKFNGGGSRPGSVEATSVPEFLQYLKKSYPNSVWQELDFSPGRHGTELAEPGDIIAYDWGHGEGISHVSVVVEKTEDTQYPIVAEWGVNDDRPAGYNKRGWTYSEKHDKWLQEDNPNIKAYLLHITPVSY